MQDPDAYPLPPKMPQQSMRGCLQVYFVVMGLFFVFLIGGLCVLLNFANQKSKEMALENRSETLRNLANAKKEMERIREETEAERKQRLIDQREPVDLADAAQGLEKGSFFRRQSCLEYVKLKMMPADLSLKKQVASGLLTTAIEERALENDALKLFRKWGDKTFAKRVSESLKDLTPGTPKKLDILERYDDPQTAYEIADLLKHFTFGRQAKDTLVAMGTKVRDAVRPHVTSSSSQARGHAREIYRRFGLDISEIQIDASLDRIIAGEQVRDCLRDLSKLDLVESKQAEVLEVLHQQFDAEKNSMSELLAALKIWGDKSSVEIVHDAIKKKMIPRGDTSLVIEFLEEMGEPSSVPVLASFLPDSWVKEDVSRALMGYGKAAENDVVKYVNDPKASKTTRNVLFAIGADEKLIIKQCASDLKSANEEVVKNSIGFLRNCETIDQDSRAEIFKSLKRYNDLVAKGFDKPLVVETVCRWSAAEDRTYLLKLLGEKDDKLWTPAYKRLLELELFDDLRAPTTLKLGDFFAKSHASKLLKEYGSKAEPLMIEMLGAPDDKVLIEACNILLAVGQFDSVAKLESVEESAKKRNSPNVARTARQAIDKIKERLEKEKADSDR